MDATERKKEIINSCLALLVEKGLTRTTTRDLSTAMKLQSGGMYYYFPSKDELIVACAEEAVLRVESSLFGLALAELTQPKLLMQHLQSNAASLGPTMKFFVSVCADKRYAERMRPVLERVGKRYTQYAERIAKELNTDVKEIMPFVFMMITAMSNYMVFDEASFVAPQLKAVQIKLERILAG